uniref:NADH-ubiquinone oxidoreductase chain 1 n=1 Tax=Phallocryptus tserensodnomi TaxID=1383053 RepID=A0A0U1Z7D0_9CRUS|nr:NADH dehydrogenase subunit 1 [Phallocryptus tserensodnomi]AJP76851.1 NADH dehydrogenase subunit 1 [Phallocryptus tserensodnomi]
MILSVFLQILVVFIGVAFLTLLERKILGYIQLRKGPNKVGFMGLLQPFADGIKLFTKEMTLPSVSNFSPYIMSPMIALFLSLAGWCLVPSMGYGFMFNYSLILFLCIVSISVYTTMVAGWSSNSKYSLLGGIRAGAQTISYEVSLILVMLSPIFLWGSYKFQFYLDLAPYIGWPIFICLPLGICWFVTILAETNRTPFDLAEGESELVSGFNTEYMGVGFALIMLAEYASIILMSFLFSLIFSGLSFILFSLVVYFFLWSRGSYPRYRYDNLMYLCWKSFLPISIAFLPLFLSLSNMF